MIAGTLGNLDIVKAVIEAGADVDKVTEPREGVNNGVKTRTALHLAAGFGNAPVVELLARSGASLSARNALGLTPLHLAAMEGRLGAAKALVAAGAELEASDDQGNTPWDLATRCAHEDLAAFLHAAKPPPPPPSPTCAVCEAAEPKDPGSTGLFTCSGCLGARYCSRACQKIHWKQHGHKAACQGGQGGQGGPAGQVGHRVD
jgi:hypothetical protein